jgi:polyhydroxybutyrate depolymerase
VALVALAALLSACGGGLRPTSRKASTTVARSTTVATAVAAPTPPPVPVTVGSTTTTTIEVLPMTETTLSLGWSQGTRDALVHVPAHTAGSRLATIIAIHGSGFDGSRFPNYTQLTSVADREGFMVVYPLGASVQVEGYPELFRSWNAGRCCPYASDDGIDDVGYLDRLLNELTSSTAADPDRITIMGHSNGAMMAQRYACERADRLAALVSVSGSLTANRCEPSRPLPMLEVHATADVEVPYSPGGLPSAVEGVEKWRFLNRCGATAVDEPIASEVTGINRRTWACDASTEVQFITMQGGDHDWVHAPTFNTEAEVWAFASRFRRRQTP